MAYHCLYIFASLIVLTQYRSSQCGKKAISICIQLKVLCSYFLRNRKTKAPEERLGRFREIDIGGISDNKVLLVETE